MWKYLKNKNGSIIIIIAVALIAFIGFAALVTDFGMLVYRKSQLQNACDASVLAGAQELPYDTANAENIARQYALDNGVDSSNLMVTFTENNHKIIVHTKDQVQFIFARIIGINQGNVEAQAAAMVAPLSKIYYGLRPFGVVDDTFAYDQQVILKGGSDDVQNGNFGALRLDEGEGASHYNEMIVEGCSHSYKVGDSIPTEPGNIVNKTIKGVEECIDNGTRIIPVPLIDSLDVNGTSEEVIILGFALFYIEDIKKVGGHTEITGRFIKKVISGGADPDQPNYGALGVKLVD